MHRSRSIPSTALFKKFCRGVHSNRFDAACEIKRIGNINSQGATHWKAVLTDIYSINGVPCGGYVTAIAVTAAKSALTTAERSMFDDCLSVTGPFHAATEHLKDADIYTEVLHVGRSNASVAVRVSQDGLIRCSFMVLLGNLSKMSGINVGEGVHGAPELPPMDQCLDASAIIKKAFGSGFRIADELELRVVREQLFATRISEYAQVVSSIC